MLVRTAFGYPPETRRLANQLSRLCLLIVGSVLWAGCDQRDQANTQGEPTAAPPAIDVSKLPAAEGPERVLRECHGEIRGMDRVAARVWLPDQTMLKLFTRLPHDIRVAYPDGGVQILDRSRAVGVRRGPGNQIAFEALDPTAAERLRAIRALIDVATLGPIRRATACERLGPQVFQISQPDGDPWQLTLQPDSLLVERLSGNGYDATIDEHLRTSVSRIVRRVTLAPLGTCTLRLHSVDFQFDDTLFRTQQQAAARVVATDKPTMPAGLPLIQMNRELRPKTPKVSQTKELWWLVMDDPGDWDKRSQVVQDQLARLREHDQKLAGFAGFLVEGGTAKLAIGFRKQDKDGPAFDPPNGWDVRHIPAQQALVVFPPSGSVEDRINVGTRQLQEQLLEQGLRATSPILAQPYFHLNEGLPPQSRLTNPVVRVSVHIGN